jgi:hypothetical protein
MLPENFSAIGIDLAEGDGSHSGALEPEAEAADAAEKVEDIHRISSMLHRISSMLRAKSSVAS